MTDRPEQHPVTGWARDTPTGTADAGSLTGVDAVEPSVGWGVLHLFYRVDRARAVPPNACRSGVVVTYFSSPPMVLAP